VLDTPETLDLTWRVMREAESVARAKGTRLDQDIVDRTMSGFQKVGGRLISSMFTDLERGYPLEVGLLNGAVARLGKEMGVPTPLNDFITRCLALPHNRAMARRFSKSTVTGG
jgi:2-dehydropantoate 2-reductase